MADIKLDFLKLSHSFVIIFIIFEETIAQGRFQQNERKIIAL